MVSIYPDIYPFWRSSFFCISVLFPVISSWRLFLTFLFCFGAGSCATHCNVCSIFLILRGHLHLFLKLPSVSYHNLVIWQWGRLSFPICGFFVPFSDSRICCWIVYMLMFTNQGLDRRLWKRMSSGARQAMQMSEVGWECYGWSTWSFSCGSRCLLLQLISDVPVQAPCFEIFWLLWHARKSYGVWFFLKFTHWQLLYFGKHKYKSERISACQFATCALDASGSWSMALQPRWKALFLRIGCTHCL